MGKHPKPDNRKYIILLIIEVLRFINHAMR